MNRSEPLRDTIVKKLLNKEEKLSSKHKKNLENSRKEYKTMIARKPI